jgi:MFS family permease
MLLFGGMFFQGIAIVALIKANSFETFGLIGALLGLGTALVYPTFINAIADYTHPSQRAESLGTFRFWRDLGYATGALLTGILADHFGIDMSILMIGVLTILSAFIILVRVEKTS